MRIREATAGDGPALIDFFRATPLDAGVEFVLDRSPDFYALLRLRGTARTFLAVAGERLAGSVTALWHDARDGSGEVRVGEIVDLRVAEWAHGSRAVALLLGATRDAFAEAGAQWAVCVIGERNRAAVPLTSGRIGLPALEPLARYASVHFVVCRAPSASARPPAGRLTVWEAGAGDGADVERLVGEMAARRRFAPLEPFRWPEPTGTHRAWIARDGTGSPIGGLILWDGSAVRRIRVMRYRGLDRVLQLGTRLAQACGLANALPPPGDALRVWASRWLGVREGRLDAARALVRAALRAAVAKHIHVVQVNLPEDDPLLHALPPYPRSTYWSTLYGCPLEGGARAQPATSSRAGHGPYHVDLALV